MNDNQGPSMQPLGDASLLVSWGNQINRELNGNVISLSKALWDKPFKGLLDCVPAYSSLTVHYDLYALHMGKGKAVDSYHWVAQYVSKLWQGLKKKTDDEARLLEIPVCYDEALGNDLTIISDNMQVSKEEIIALHSGKNYHIYMAGFIPGFVYMAAVDDKIAIPRKQKPVTVSPGSVGIAGVQTGIYPATSPGGWHIVGFTAQKLFDAENAEDPCLLHAGDSVRFVPVTVDEYRRALKKETPA